jgi:hypothetical protein
MTQRTRINRCAHVRKPGVTLSQANREPRMTHAQARMSTLVVVRRRAAPILAQKESEVALGVLQVRRVHRTKNVVIGHADVKAIDQIVEELLASHSFEERAHPLDGRRPAPTTLQFHHTGHFPVLFRLAKAAIARGCSSMAESQPSKLVMRVRSPSPAHL